MDRRKALAPGSRLVFRTKNGFEEYTILREIGRGGSCIVYDAAITDNLGNPKPVRIKECYPHAVRIRRMEDNSLAADPGEEERFREKIRRMREAYRLQHELFYTEGLMNSVTGTWNFHEANGTAYVVSLCLNGETLADHTCGSVHECIALLLSTAGVLRRIHEAGYLYLDLKPENILTVRGTTDLVQLFDFDSLVPMAGPGRAAEDGGLCGVRVSYTRGFASLEQAAGRIRELGPASDVYSLGAVLFHTLWGRVPTAFDCEQDARYDYGSMLFPADQYQDRLFRELTEFFHHTLAGCPGDRYGRMEDAAEQLRKAALLSDETIPWIVSAPVCPPAFFTGRAEDLKELDRLLHTSGGRLFSLAGMGGIGKSILARAYLASRRDAYDAVVWMDDRGTADEMIADDSAVHVSNTERTKEEPLQDYAARKKRILREIAAGQHVLAVIDNADPAHLNELASLSCIGWDMLLISRETLPEGFCPALRLGELREDALAELFVHYARTALATEQDREDFGTIAGRVCGHTLTVELLARQIAKGFLTLHESAQLVKRTGLKGLPADRIDYVRDRKARKATLASILDELVEKDRFTDSEKQIMKVLSAFDYRGIRADLLRTLLDVPDLEAISELESGGWLAVRRGQITLHPLMLEYLRTWKWDESCRQAADTAMGNLYRMIQPAGKQDDADRQYTNRYGELRGLLEAAEQLIAAADYVSAPKQRLRYRVLMDAPVDRDEAALEGMLELLEHPAFLGGGRILRLYENSAFLMDRLLRHEDALAQLGKMKEYLSGHPSTFGRSLYHRAMATVLHNADIYGSLEECLKHLDSAVFTARVSRHSGAKAQLAACLLDKATVLLSTGTDDGQARALIQEAEPLVLRYTGGYDDERYLYHCIAAMYAAGHGDPDGAEQHLAEATRMADTARDSDLAYIDHLVEQSAWIYRAMKRYDRAAGVLKEAIAICARHPGVNRYYQVRISTCLFLAEIREDAGEEELCAEAIAEAKRLREESPWPLEDSDPILMA